MGKVGVDWQEKRNNGHAGRWKKDQKGGRSRGRNVREATRKGRRLRSTGEMNPARIVPAPYNVQSSRASFSKRAMRYDAMRCYAGAFLSVNKPALLHRKRFLVLICILYIARQKCIKALNPLLKKINIQLNFVKILHSYIKHIVQLCNNLRFTLRVMW